MSIYMEKVRRAVVVSRPAAVLSDNTSFLFILLASSLRVCSIIVLVFRGGYEAGVR